MKNESLLQAICKKLLVERRFNAGILCEGGEPVAFWAFSSKRLCRDEKRYSFLNMSKPEPLPVDDDSDYFGWTTITDKRDLVAVAGSAAVLAASQQLDLSYCGLGTLRVKGDWLLFTLSGVVCSARIYPNQFSHADCLHENLVFASDNPSLKPKVLREPNSPGFTLTWPCPMGRSFRVTLATCGTKINNKREAGIGVPSL